MYVLLHQIDFITAIIVTHHTQELMQVEARSSNQVTELQLLAEKHFNRANSLEAELLRVKKDVVVTKKQVSIHPAKSVTPYILLFLSR